MLQERCEWVAGHGEVCAAAACHTLSGVMGLRRCDVDNRLVCHSCVEMCRAWREDALIFFWGVCMRHLVIDTSSVLWMSLLAGKSKEFGYEVEHNGKTVWVNGWEHGLDAAISHITAVARELEFSAGQMVFVVEGAMSKARRVAMYSGYKENRGSRPKESYDEFNTCKVKLASEFMGAGATVVRQDGVEGDDVIAYLCQKLEGEKVILSQDRGMAALISDNVALFRNGALVKSNPFGPFDFKHIPVYKALVGYSSDGIKECPGFDDKAFLDLLVWGGKGVLPAMRGVIEARELHTLEDDVAEFKPMRKIIDNAQAVYASYDVALLRPEWVNTERVKLDVQKGSGSAEDERVTAITSSSSVPDTFSEPEVEKQHYVFDCELIGTTNPVFLVCFEGIESGEKFSFWHHVPGDMDKMKALLQRKDITFVSFNGIHFDQPLLWAALSGLSTIRLKQLANHIITEGKSFGTSEMFGYAKSPSFDHIDLMEVTPGVKISLKTYAGRIGFETMVDMPFDHTDDLEDEQLPILEAYCQNDLGVTKALFNMLREEIRLREEIGAEHKLDLRSKSDAQLAEAVLKKVANIKSKPDIPLGVTYSAPPFIQTESTVIRDILERIEAHTFKINQANGSPEAPEFLSNPIKLGHGTYQMGIGGLHSTHDNRLYVEADDETVCVSDIDVSSYYPFTMVNAGIIPKIERGQAFLDTYKKMLFERIAAKRRMVELEVEITEIERELANVE